ncbi:MAG: hypothetical protein PWQ96_1745 [Clostridia bacterium]|nr:hypothetical protein [Clostridia bacterium]
MKKMEKGLVKFINLLRTLGIRVSTAEAMDALEALQYVNVMDKNSVRVALQSMLVKEEDKIPVFEAAFETFFVTPERKQEQQQNLQNEKDKQQQLLAEAEEDLTFQDSTLELEQEEKLLYSELDEKRKEKLQEFLQKSSQASHHNPEKFKSVLENLVKQHLKYWKNTKEYVAPLPVEETGNPELDASLAELNNLDPEKKKLLYQDMQSIAEEELPLARKIMKQFSKKLASRISRNYHRSKKRRQIDFRGTIRKNISYGGTPLKLQYRSKRIKKTQLVLLCDVSGSMNRYSSFVTSFVYSLASVLKRIDTFLFSENLEKLEIGSLPQDNYEDAVFKMMENSKVWGEGTNINKALKQLLKNYSEVLTRKTIFIIVSDTKTLAVEEAAKKLQKIRGRVKEVIFLNTLPKEEWQGKHTVEILKKSSTMYPCHTIADLKNLSSIWLTK